MIQTTRWITIIALFAIPFLPLYVASGMFFPFITGKGFAFRILVEIAFVAWAALAILDPRYRPRFSWTFVLFSAFTLWILIADLLAVNVPKALWSNFERMDGFVTLIHLFMFFVAASSLLSVDKLWRKWWLTFIGVSALVCGHALLQFFGVNQINQGGVRVDATFGNAIYLAVYLMFTACITMWQAFESKGWVKYTLLAFVVLQVLILFNTATRGAVIAIVGAAVFAALLYMLDAGKRTRNVAAGLLIGLTFVVGGFWVVRDSAFVQNSPIFSRIAAISLDELKVRFTLWDMAVDAVKDRPLTGFGQEGFNYVFNQEYRPSLYAQEPWFDRAHSAYVDWLVAGGIPALGLFVALLISGILALYRDRRSSRAQRIFLVSALVGYALQAIVVFDNLFSYIPLMAILAMAHFVSSRPIQALEKLPQAKSPHATAIVMAGALVAGIFLVFQVNVPHMKAAGNLVYAVSALGGSPDANLNFFRKALQNDSFATQEIREHLISYSAAIAGNPKVPERLRAEFVGLAISEMQKEVLQTPGDARLRMQLALAYRIGGLHDKALEEIEVATTLSPKKQTFLLEKGNVLIAAGRIDEARSAFYAAYDLDPSFDSLAVYRAAGDILAGDTVAGKAFLMERLGTTTIDSPILVGVYYETKQYDELIPLLVLQAQNANRSSESILRLSSGYILTGSFKEARTLLMTLIRTNPEVTKEAQAMLVGLPVVE